MNRVNAKRTRIASLDCLSVEGAEHGPTVVLFHGFGADCTDLASLVQVLPIGDDVNWVFPNGHLSVPIGGHYEGRAWFPISIADLERSMMTGQPLDLSEIVPPGLEDARDRAMELIAELNVPANRLLIGGFSQGGMLATEVTLHLDSPPAGLAILSGTLINSQRWKQLAPRHKGLAFFQSHGAHDPVLGFSMAQRLEQLLLEAGWVGQLLKFNGGHEIPPVVCQSLAAYMRKRLKK